tara:strand:- start:2099 stop:3004 length:906 start_codon:yes stop_codon:yes gene_type:complete
VIKLPSGVDINNLIDDLRIFSWEAADILLFYSKIIKDGKNKKDIIKTKNNNEPVTEADLKVNETIIKRINEKYKDIKWEILSEENSKSDYSFEYKTPDWLWILDPLDGTKDFIQGTSNYAMHLGLNYKNKSLLGLVLIPAKDELWIGYGGKVWCERRDGSRKKCIISKKINLRDMTIVTSKNHRNEVLENLIEKSQFKKRIIMGSIGCKIASILRGESDIYISLSLPGKSYPKDWDFAAPAAILKAAGGAITNLENNQLIYNKSNFEQDGIIIATSNKENHKSICLRLKEIIISNNILPLV